jgi:single-stranded-DNA-specific exonuclease
MQKTLGIDFVVCDHHLPGKELPPAVAILNPNRRIVIIPAKTFADAGWVLN